jgi:uroporphyrinogen decarboxylase
MNDLFLRACKRQKVERTPVWMMRQAGRYLPEYRAVRAKSNFLTMCKTPELAAEVTVQPVDIIGVDAAIIFSDILVVPEAMGMKLELIESKGPQFHNPVRTRDDVEALKVADPEKKLRFVAQALETTKRILGKRVPLIGFAGSPWTLAAYMIEGSGGKDWKFAKQMMLNEPELMKELLSKLATSVRLYLEMQLAAGADAIQIFDTWGGVLTPDQYKRFSLDFIHDIVAKLHRNGQPVIVFSKGANHSLKEIADIGADVVGLDWTVDIHDVRNLIGEKVALQGNLDPAALYASPDVIRQEVKTILKKFGKGSGHVFNLGHGIAPDVPVEHAKAMVAAVKELSSLNFQP